MGISHALSGPLIAKGAMHMMGTLLEKGPPPGCHNWQWVYFLQHVDQEAQQWQKVGIPREPGPSTEGQDIEGGGPPYGDENNDNHHMNSFRVPASSSCGGELNACTFENSTSSDTKLNCRSYE